MAQEHDESRGWNLCGIPIAVERAPQARLNSRSAAGKEKNGGANGAYDGCVSAR